MHSFAYSYAFVASGSNELSAMNLRDLVALVTSRGLSNMPSRLRIRNLVALALFIEAVQDLQSQRTPSE
jgi:hypothetical protein